MMDMNPAIMRARFNMSGYEVNLLKDRSMLDSQDALAYALWFLINGRVGSRADRNYLDAEIAKRRFMKLSSVLQSYRYEKDDGGDDEKVPFSKVAEQSVTDDSTE